MKKIIITAIAFLIALFNLKAAVVTDSIYKFEDKTVVVNDSAGKIVVKVRAGDDKELKQVYEGIFSDEKSFEKWTVMEDWGISIPFINKPAKKKKKSMEAHWAGLGWGFANISNSSYAINNIEGISLKAEKSTEFYFNPIEKIIPIIGNTVGITTGFGLNWKNYNLDNNQHLVELNNKIIVEDAPQGVNYTYSRLRTFGLNIPVLLDFQTKIGGKKTFFISAGVVGGVNTFSSYRVKYELAGQGKINTVESKGLNINPLTLDYMAQIGYGAWSIYAKYSPISIFQSEKGPKVNSVSMGATLNF